MRDELKRLVKIAVVGDVHDQWETADTVALKQLGIDLVLFVGDFGNESVPVVEAIAALDLPKAVILGNHDCWYTASPWGQKKRPYDPKVEDRVRAQLEALGEVHVGYGCLNLPQFQLSVVGSRPFSWGGSEWKNAEFYRDRFGVNNFAESTQRIVTAAQSAAYETMIFLGHCGPLGLGDRAEDPCGRDWFPLGGDYGDPDFQAAIAQTQTLGKIIPLVAFGHMHHNLRHTKDHLRKSVVVSPEGTVYLNAARVPRIIQTDFHGQQHNFSLVTLESGQVTEVSFVWVKATGELVSEQMLYRQSSSLAQPA